MTVEQALLGLKAITFDIDSVIDDTGSLHRKVFRKALSPAGVPFQ